jgi:hypothetical protein
MAQLTRYGRLAELGRRIACIEARMTVFEKRCVYCEDEDDGVEEERYGDPD